MSDLFVQAQGLLYRPGLCAIQPLRQFVRLPRPEDASEQVVCVRARWAGLFLELVRDAFKKFGRVEAAGRVPVGQPYRHQSGPCAGEWARNTRESKLENTDMTVPFDQIVLSHFARSTADLGPSESFVSRQLRTTMDVVCNEWIEFFHGGLHLQVTHHLFPRIPRHNLRRASKLVKEYCREQEIEYAEYSFTEGNKRVLGVLRDVADQVSLLTKVAEADARGELH